MAFTSEAQKQQDLETEHQRKDAHAAVQLGIKMRLDKFKRRIYAEAIEEADRALQHAINSREVVDGTAIGFEAARRAASGYIGENGPHRAIEAATSASDY